MNYETKHIEEKIKVVQIYNQKRDKFSSRIHENITMRIIADLMLDCLEFKNERLIKNPNYLIQDFNNFKN
jgi:hypothetical protein